MLRLDAPPSGEKAPGEELMALPTCRRNKAKMRNAVMPKFASDRVNSADLSTNWLANPWFWLGLRVFSCHRRIFTHYRLCNAERTQRISGTAPNLPIEQYFSLLFGFV